jgi:hypothetical protein
MDNKIDGGFRIHGGEESDGDSMWWLRCDIIDQKSHSPCMNKTHRCATSFCLKTSWKWKSLIWILSNKTPGGRVLTKVSFKEQHHKLINMFGL